MRYPESLKPGGTIGFIAPSFGCAIEPYQSRFENAIKLFKDKGYQIWLGPNCYEGSGIGISNTPSACAAELNEAMTNPELADVIITCGGGELMCEVVPYIDFERIKKSPAKWYMGYSDNTNYTFLSAILADTAAIYGPCAPAFGREPWHASVEDAWKLLTGELHKVSGYEMWEHYETDSATQDTVDTDTETPNTVNTDSEIAENEEDPLAPYNVNERTVYQYYLPTASNSISSSGSVESAESHLHYDKRKAGLDSENTGIEKKMVLISGDDLTDTVKFEGRLLGGCVDILILLAGTKYDKVDEFLERYKEDGFIWFLESCDLSMLSIRRAFWQMREAGWFQYAKGFLIGRPLHYGEDQFGVNQYNAVIDIIGDLGVPIIMDLDIGHLPPMMPIICGSYAAVEAEGNRIGVNYIFK
ncbi:MAG: LD-carboxypeptidase [Lachnospiraceae bacterium]|nr:LD-carboxypeptidase [Lachnospiraceae bacterium]